MRFLLTSAILFLTTIICDVSSRKFPSFIPQCKRDDPNLSKCFDEVVEKIRPRLIKGIPELNLNPIDPMVIPKLLVTNYTASALGVDAELTNMTFTGGKDFVIKKHSIDFNIGECYTELFIPKLNVETLYRIKGKLLFFNIDSKGTAQAAFEDINVKTKLVMKKYKKNGKNYLKFDAADFNLTLAKGRMHLDDIFPNNPGLSQNTNKVINDNMDVLIEDIKPLIIKTTKNLILNIINRVYDLYSFEELWP